MTCCQQLEGLTGIYLRKEKQFNKNVDAKVQARRSTASFEGGGLSQTSPPVPPTQQPAGNTKFVCLFEV